MTLHIVLESSPVRRAAGPTAAVTACVACPLAGVSRVARRAAHPDLLRVTSTPPSHFPALPRLFSLPPHLSRDSHGTTTMTRA